MRYELQTPGLAEVNARHAAFAQRLAEISIMACDEEGKAVAKHPEIKGLSNGKDS